MKIIIERIKAGGDRACYSWGGKCAFLDSNNSCINPFIDKGKICTTTKKTRFIFVLSKEKK
jgi:hypothetical protein